jgi:aromatic ring-opening dioxygenase catalytic subunit (LigB family)
MRGFGLERSTQVAELFTHYLDDAIAQQDVHIRDERLLQWEHGPAARQAHPQEDHLMPLLVAAGAAGSSHGRVLFTEHVMKIPMTSYVFGDLD